MQAPNPIGKNLGSVGRVAIVAVAFVACGKDSAYSERQPAVTTDTVALWSGNERCDECLQTICDDTSTIVGGTPKAYSRCKDDAGWRNAMAAFSGCFGARSALTECAGAIDELRGVSPAGSELLDCLLLKCFFEACDTIHSSAARQ